MSERSLRDRVASFDEKHYRFVDFTTLGDFPQPERTPDRAASEAKRANRHQQRYRHFFEPLLKLFGGSLNGHRVLDLACNAGFWSLKATEAGADYVRGVDGREIHIDHANLVFEAKGVDLGRYKFEIGNVLDILPSPAFDVVLCLGLLYHVAKPVELFEVMSEAKVIVIDTELSLIDASAFEVGHESTEERTNSIDYELILWPTRQAVIDLAHQFGFECVSLPLDMTDTRGMEGYTDGHRLAFICARELDLSGLPREVAPVAARGNRSIAGRARSRLGL